MSSGEYDVMTDTSASYRIRRVCIWAGPVGLVLVFGCLAISGMLPPKPTAAWDAAQVADWFAEHHLRVIVGQLGSMWAVVILTLFFAAVSVTMAGIEGKRPVLAVAQIAGWTILAVFFLIPATLWIAAAYRTGRDPELDRLLNDLAWFNLLVPLTPNVLQLACVACVGFCDRSPDPVWPRWFCWYTVQACLVIPISMAIPLVHGGPFAWNGVLGFWFPGADAGVWFVLCAVLMNRALQREFRAADAARSA